MIIDNENFETNEFLLLWSNIFLVDYKQINK